MFAYCNNNPVKLVDYQGDDACLVIDHDAAHGNGHINLFVQDDSGCWYYYSFASDEGTLKTVIWNVIFDSPVIGKVTKIQLGYADGYDLSTFDGFKSFITSTGKVSHTAEEMDTAIYFKGDYSETQYLCEQGAEYMSYHVYGFNCMHFALSRLNYSKQIKGFKQMILFCTNTLFYAPNEAEPYLCKVGEELK